MRTEEGVQTSEGKLRGRGPGGSSGFLGCPAIGTTRDARRFDSFHQALVALPNDKVSSFPSTTSHQLVQLQKE